MATTARPTTRLPMTTLGKVIFGIQLFLAIGSFVGGIFTSSISLYTISLTDLVVGILIATGFRWAPILGAVIGGIGLIYVVFINPYPQYHLSHPKDPLFSVIVIVVGLSVLTFAAMLAAVAQNYFEPERHLPRWFSLVLTGVIGAVIGAVLIGAIAQPEAATVATTASDGAIIVHMGVSNFNTTAITVPQGGKVDFVDDSNIVHILSYGTWTGTRTSLETPVGAPVLADKQIAGGNFELGPFTAPGVYHILCTVHPGMMLTVTVS